ncbi:hypothetical protein ALC62_04576, partial [Cyphomyrmex costatus]
RFEFPSRSNEMDRARRCGLEAEYLRVNGNPPVCLQTSETGSKGSLCERTRPIHGLSDRAKEPSSMGGTKRIKTDRPTDPSGIGNPPGYSYPPCPSVLKELSNQISQGNLSASRCKTPRVEPTMKGQEGSGMLPYILQAYDDDGDDTRMTTTDNASTVLASDMPISET